MGDIHMTKKAIIFDMDGVIFDTERAYLKCWQEVYKEHGYEITEEFYITLLGKDRPSIMNILYDTFGKDFKAEYMFNLCDLKLKECIERKEVPIKEGVLEIFDYLKKNGYKMALATSSPKPKLNMQLKIHNLEEVFDAIVCGDDVTVSKPNPEIFLKSAEKLGVSPDECIVIEDSPAGIMAGYNAGMTSFHVEDLKKADEEIIQYSDKQFKNLIEVREYLNL